MFTISERQMSQLATETMANRLFDHLMESFPDQVGASDKAELRPAIIEQMELADRYGFETEQQVAIFVTSAWLLGLGFDQRYPAVQECLVQSGLMPGEKAEWLQAFAETMFLTLEAR